MTLSTPAEEPMIYLTMPSEATQAYVMMMLGELRPDLPVDTRLALAACGALAITGPAGVDMATSLLFPVVGPVNARQLAWLLAGAIRPAEETLVKVDVRPDGLIADLVAPAPDPPDRDAGRCDDCGSYEGDRRRARRRFRYHGESRTVTVWLCATCSERA